MKFRDLSPRVKLCANRIGQAVREKESFGRDMSDDVAEVRLTPADIPGAELCEPYESLCFALVATMQRV